MYRHKIYQNLKRRIKPKQNVPSQTLNTKKTEIEIKDILIPLFSAVFAVFLNQIFFESNRRVEAQIEYEREMLKTQTPALNWILAFTYKYHFAIVTYFTVPTQEIIYTNVKTGKIIRKDKKELLDEIDSVSVTVPFFVVDQTKREKLFSDLESLKQQRDILDHEIYIAFENIIEFLDANKLPELTNKNEILVSVWKSEKVQKEWEQLMVELRTLCSNKIEKFKSSS
jgi:hypothetical protein